jgi:hypothetical protein
MSKHSEGYFVPSLREKNESSITYFRYLRKAFLVLVNKQYCFPAPVWVQPPTVIDLLPGK